mgnify:CR=1 FL=1
MTTKQLFINKYKPTLFKDFYTDNDAIDVLNSLISFNTVNIIIVGDKSSGKTTMLQAIIREYYNNCEPTQYDENVLYINSLQEQGINYYRTDVKTFCQSFSSIKNRKKILVLDDIDLINEQSQQTFRNYIDKYSHNVNFISSCNSVQKVAECIQSRLFNIKINPLKTNQIIDIVNKIKSQENINIDDAAQQFIIHVSNNNAKTVISYMEKFKLLNEPITIEKACQLCTNISFLIFEEYTNLIINKKIVEAIKLIYNIFDKGYSVIDILDNYFIFIKNTNCVNEEQKYNIIPNICKYIAVFNEIHEHEIELALFTNNIAKCV